MWSVCLVDFDIETDRIKAETDIHPQVYPRLYLETIPYSHVGQRVFQMEEVHTDRTYANPGCCAVPALMLAECVGSVLAAHEFVTVLDNAKNMVLCLYWPQ